MTTNPIIRGARLMGRFSGRDRRGQFWPFAGTVVGVWFAVYAIALNLAMFWTFDQASHDSFVLLVFSFAGISVLLLALALAAAISRRLHDVGHSSLWALIPLTLFLVAVGLLGMVVITDVNSLSQPAEPAFGVKTFLGIMLANVFYNISFVTLIVFLCLKSQPGPNRFGEQPQ